MSHSGPVYINRPSQIYEQFRDRILATDVDNPTVMDAAVRPFGGGGAVPVNVVSDVRGLYFTFIQVSAGGNESIDLFVVADGVAYTGNLAAAATGTVYYVYLDEDADALLTNVNVTGMKNLFPWYARTMYVGVVQTTPVNLPCSLTANIRYEQL